MHCDFCSEIDSEGWESRSNALERASTPVFPGLRIQIMFHSAVFCVVGWFVR
jgi:hypothetical protein